MTVQAKVSISDTIFEHIDECLANGKDGVYSFRAQGAIYHKIGSLLPTPGNRPRFIQLYIYDTDHEVDRTIAENN